MGFRFKGTVLAGAQKGDVIEFNDHEKAEAAFKLALAENPEIEGEHPFEGQAVYASQVTVQEVTSSDQGDRLKGKWANKIYRAGGTAVICPRDPEKNKLLPERVMNFSLRFADQLDANGLPDIQIKKLELEKS